MFVLLFDNYQWFVEFYWLVVFDQNGFYYVGFVGFDLVYYFYCFDDVQGVVYVNFLVNFYKCFCVWVWCMIESINYWGMYDVIIDFCFCWCFSCSSWCGSCGGRCLRLYYWCSISLLYNWIVCGWCRVVDVNRFFVFRNFQFGDI